MAEPPPSDPTDTPAAHTAQPPTGIARGKWEAPVWAFYVVFGVVAALALGYALYQLGVFKRRSVTKR